MATKDVAEGLVSLCKSGQFSEAITRYYADTIVSVEAMCPEGGSPETHGLAAVQAKQQWWNENHDTHGAQIEGPYVNGDQFAVRFQMDVTFKPKAQRFALTEVAIYTVADDKVVHERFFYGG